jgi:transposase-like protein
MLQAGRKLKEATRCLREGVGEITTYLLNDYPQEHRRRIRTNNMIDWLNSKIRHRTRFCRQLPDGKSALVLIRVRIRHVTANGWFARRYLDMFRLQDTMNKAN